MVVVSVDETVAMSERTYTRRELQELPSHEYRALAGDPPMEWQPKRSASVPLYTLYAVTARHRILYLICGPDPEAQLRRILDRRPSEPGRVVEELGRLRDEGDGVSGWVSSYGAAKL